MNLNQFAETRAVDFSARPASCDSIQAAQRVLNVPFGPQLKEYLTRYGYLGFGSVEFYGMNECQQLRSDLVTQTQYLHRYYPATVGYVAVENTGEGCYALVDRKDRMIRYLTETGETIALQEDLNGYILRRFQEEEGL